MVRLRTRRPVTAVPEAAAAREAVRLDSSDARFRNALANVLALERKWVDAEKEYREAIRLRPD